MAAQAKSGEVAESRPDLLGVRRAESVPSGSNKVARANSSSGRVDTSAGKHRTHSVEFKRQVAQELSIGPLIAGCCQATPLSLTTGNAVAVAQSELVGIVKAGRARLTYDCQLGIGHLVGRVQHVRIDAIAGVMVLSEVAKRLMMMSGSGASTCTTECGRSATSRLTEVTTTTVPAGHRRPGVPGQEL